MGIGRPISLLMLLLALVVLVLLLLVICPLAADALAAAVGFLQHPLRDVGAVIRVIEDLVASHPC